jgi:hypothetical protein
MKRLLLAAAIVAGSCSLVMAQGTGGAGTGGAGPSAAPAVQNPGGGMSSDKAAGKPRVAKVKKKKKSSM